MLWDKFIKAHGSLRSKHDKSPTDPREQRTDVLANWRTGVASVLLIKCKTAPTKGGLVDRGREKGWRGCRVGGVNSTRLNSNMQRKLGIAYMANVAFVACPQHCYRHIHLPHTCTLLCLHPSHIHYAPFVTLWPFALLTNAHNNCQIWQNGSATAILNRKLPNICPATFFSFSLSLSLCPFPLFQFPMSMSNWAMPGLMDPPPSAGRMWTSAVNIPANFRIPLMASQALESFGSLQVELRFALLDHQFSCSVVNVVLFNL